ncbi:hypothetical protein [Methylomonas koyamae]|uniref:hypothetical protein n=1 Tax=Methylomonas koyamae TaxID=702114 RepID=UPI002873EDFA|nr:hypothetical protein [Methylomonas koyamae]WNB73961.1 hypothetical protein RI210_11740 [Methylomonas koyamae]
MSYLFDTLSPNFARNQQAMLERDRAELPQPEPGVFTGLDQADTYTNALGTIGQEAKAVGGLALSQWPKALDKALDSGETFQDLWMGAVVDPAITQRKALRLDPRTHGIAAQVVNSLATMLPEAIAVGPLGVGLLSGISDTAEQIQEGKPLATAAEFGAVTGVANAIGLAAPAALPVSAAWKAPALLQRITTGAATNLALGIPERYAKHQILAEAGYLEQAEQWRWNDATALAIDAALGAGFGALAHVQAKPSEIDAALAANEARSIDSRAPGLPITAEAANAHTETFYRAMDHALNDEAIRAELPMSERPLFSPDLIAQAGNRMSRGERQTLERQKADIEYKLADFDNQASLSGYAKADFIDLARAEQPRYPARRIAALAEKMAADAKQSDRAELQSLLDTISRKLTQDDQYRAAHAELSRIEQGYWRENGFVRKAQEESTTIEQGARPADPEIPAGQTMKVSQPAPQPSARDTASVIDQPAAHSAPDKLQASVGQTRPRSISPEIDSARQWLDSYGDRVMPYLDDDGNERQASLRDLLSEVDNDLADLDRIDAATQAAITCFLKFGDTV